MAMLYPIPCYNEACYKGTVLYIVFLSQPIIFVIANSANPVEMSHFSTFHLALHCLPKYPFINILYTKG